MRSMKAGVGDAQVVLGLAEQVVGVAGLGEDAPRGEAQHARVVDLHLDVAHAARLRVCLVQKVVGAVGDDGDVEAIDAAADALEALVLDVERGWLPPKMPRQESITPRSTAARWSRRRASVEECFEFSSALK
jgi:hypothetical protein